MIKKTLDLAITTTPKTAGLTDKQIEKIGTEIIKYERNCVSGISAALGIPGGYAMALTVPADIVQFYGYLLRATQKLLYLYGFQQIDVKDTDSGLDTTTINLITICLGVMYGVHGARDALLIVSKALANGVEKKIMQAALTKGVVYPIIKKITKWFGIKMTKALLAGFVKKAIPIIGGGLGFAITFLSFKPCCEKLRKGLKESYLYNKVDNDEDKDIIDVNVENIVDDADIDADYTNNIVDESYCPSCNKLLQYKDVFSSNKNVCSCPNCGEQLINPNCKDEYIWYCNKCDDIMNNQSTWHGETGDKYKCEKCGAINDLSTPDSFDYEEK